MNSRTNTSRLAFLALVVALVTSLVTPADAANGGTRDDVRRRKASLVADLDVLTSSEVELQAATDLLAASVATHSVQVDTTRRAAAAAEAEVARLEAELATTTRLIEQLKLDLVSRAVDTFVRPSEISIVDVVESSDPADAGRKQALLDLVMAHDTNVVAELQVAEEELVRRRPAAEAARQQVTALRAEAEARLADLEGALAEQARLKAAVDTRRAEVLAEIDQLAAAEAELNALVASRTAAAAAERRPAGSGPSIGAEAGSGAAGRGGCVFPARGAVTSEFGSRWGRLHAGIDIAGPIGTPIWAAKAGSVVVAGSQSGYGTTVVLDHGGGMTTLYGHQSRLAVRTGQTVRQGQVIGYVGNTGQSTGPHLHFETRYGGSPRNPRGCLG